MIDTDAIREALQQYLDVDIAADIWDEEPNLVLIIRGTDDVLDFSEVPIDSDGWAAAEPYLVIRAAADAATLLHARTGWSPFVTGEELLGVAAFTEGWGLSERDAEAIAQVQDWMQKGHRLSEHPLSVEVKVVTAVFVSGDPIMLVHARGGVPMPETDEGDIGGRMPDALVYFLSTFSDLMEEKEK